MKFRIRSKLAAALLLPLVALVGLSGFEATQAQAEADRVDEETDLALVALGPGSLTAALQNERTFVSLDVIGLTGATELEVESYDQARDEVTTAADQLAGQLSSFDAEVRDAYAPALEALSGLDDIRADYEAFEGPGTTENLELADTLFSSYTEVIGEFFTATSTLASQVDDAALRNGVEIVDAVNRRYEAIAVTTRTIALDAISGGAEGAIPAIAATAQQVRTMQDRIDGLSGGAYSTMAEDASRPQVDRAIELFDSYVAGEPIDLAELLQTADVGDAGIRQAATEVLLREAAAISAAARDDVQIFVIAAAVIISLAILITYFATASITRPLRALRKEADEMAVHRLPEAVLSILDTPFGEDAVIPELPPIRIKTSDEVADVVAALNEVQARTLSLAADQAVLRRNVADSFVNLGRRNQLLLDRQLDFITQLEQSETDPDALDSLFKLDHLATRMRRNAESLLVLAGAESPRQWGGAVALTDVVRAGLGEVEDYQRVIIRHLEDAHVLGGSAAGLAHVIAELAENALAFSPPGEDVEVKGRMAAEGYVLAIVDNGIGMSAADLDQANVRLSGHESYTVAPSRYLGHYVAGNLAAQLGVEVRLQDDPAGGLVATIVIPEAVLAVEDHEPAVEPDPVVDLDALAHQPPAETPSAAVPVIELPIVEAPVAETPVVEAPVEVTSLDDDLRFEDDALDGDLDLPGRHERTTEPAWDAVPHWDGAPGTTSHDELTTDELINDELTTDHVTTDQVTADQVTTGEVEADSADVAAAAVHPTPVEVPSEPVVDTPVEPISEAPAAPEPMPTAAAPAPPAPLVDLPRRTPGADVPAPLDALPKRSAPQPWTPPAPPATLAEALPPVPDAPGPLLDGGTTDAGLPKRVPGAQRPDASPLTRRHADDGAAATEAPDPAAAAASALGFLEAFGADTTTSYDTTHHTPHENDPEEQR